MLNCNKNGYKNKRKASIFWFLDCLQKTKQISFSIADGQRAVFPPSVIRQREFENKVKSWKFSVIRIQFPDGVILQGTFHSLEPGKKNYSKKV